MITFYTWATPNGSKVAAMLEECGLAYRLQPVDLRRGEQRDPLFLALNPNGKIPVIVDPDGPGDRPLVLAESAAIVLYLAEKAQRFVPTEPVARLRAMEAVMFQMSAVGPIFGQLHHFQSAALACSYAHDRFEREGRRILSVLDGQLAGSPHLAGEDYSVADICTWPWIRSWQYTLRRDLKGFENVARWYGELAQRSAIRKAVQIYDDLRATPGPEQ